MLEYLNNANDKKRILCFLNGNWHDMLYINIFKSNPDIIFYVLFPYSLDHSIEINTINLEITKLNNVYIIYDFNKIKYCLNAFGCFITTNCLNTNINVYKFCCSLIKQFKRFSIPTIGLQHGLFQTGLNYYIEAYGINNSHLLPNQILSDYILTYYKIDNIDNQIVIGYPPYSDLKQTYKGEYGLILSNLHWKIYGNEEKYLFYKTVLEFVENSEEQLFIWKMHQGECENKECSEMIDDLFYFYPKAKEKILFYHRNLALQNTKTLDVIAKSKYVISSLSSILLDCEMFKKTVYLYTNLSIQKLVNKLKKVDTFTNYNDLKNQYNPLKLNNFNSCFLHKYDNIAFRNFINNIYITSNISSGLLLEQMSNN